MAGLATSERFVILTFPHSEFAAFKRALEAVANLDDLRDYIGVANSGVLFDLEEVLKEYDNLSHGRGEVDDA